MQKELKSLWDTCVTFHGHGCGGLAVGFRAVLYAWELFGSGRAAEDEEIVCVAETDACGVDAIQALMSCTVGKGNLIFNSALPPELYRFKTSISIGRDNCVHRIFSSPWSPIVFSLRFIRSKSITQLPKAVLFIQSDGAGIVAAPGVLHIFTPGA